MPTEIRNHECIKTRHKESLNQMKSLLSSIAKFEGNPPTQEIYSLVVKKFMFVTATVPDDYFLSDVCELTYELFVEFRLTLGYYESGKSKKLAASMMDTVEMCTDICRKFKEFLSDPGYNGTNFPKPAKLKAMRELAGIVADKEDVVVLRKSDVTDKKKSAFAGIHETRHESESRHVAIDMNFLQQIDKQTELELNSNGSSGDSDTSSISTSSSNSVQTPLAPQLSNEEIGAMKSVASLGGGGSRKGSMFVAAMGDLMPPPPPPQSNHGRIRYVEAEENAPTPPPPPSSRRASNPYTSSQLRPPILVDDDGDILPSTGVPNFPLQPQLKSAAASIYESSDGRIIVEECTTKSYGFTPKNSNSSHYSRVLEDDDSFIQAYREYVMESGGETLEQRSSSIVDKREVDRSEFDSSGWSLKNRQAVWRK